ncbi:MAG: DEAD/DEAH box helicase [Fibrobacterales bacterium]
MVVNGPLIVQSDLEILVEVDNEHYIAARDSIAPFTELVKSPEHMHTYRISHLSLWNAASAGLTPDDVVTRLEEYAKFPVPAPVITEVGEYMGRYGKLILAKDGDRLMLESDDDRLIFEVGLNKSVQPFLLDKIDENRFSVRPETRGRLKMVLTNLGFPVRDLAGYVLGDPLNINLRERILQNGEPLVIRDYQKASADVFYASGNDKGGSGVIVLPCGAGKTIVGIAAMALIKSKTLILSPNVTSARQWIREIVDKTDMDESDIKEYSGDVKEIGDVTIATYQILTQRKRKTKKEKEDEKEYKKKIAGLSESEVVKIEYPHFNLFEKNNWGLIIYDEVHLLPAPVFRVSAEMQATRRLGLTATLIREDGKETEVFSLIGPKKYDVPWKNLEAQGWIAKANCEEIRIKLDPSQRMEYAVAEMKDKIKIASCNKRKNEVINSIMETFSGEEDRVLIIGQYLEQLHDLAEVLGIPVITGKMKNTDRDVLYKKFRTGEEKKLIVSKVGNFAIDLPDANVLIQISGTFGSRQEEAQRLGRVLRPKANGGQAHFFSVVTKESREQEFAMKRQLFLAEQGYEYKITSWDEE